MTKKIIILLIIACLGAGAGVYTASKTKNFSFSSLFKGTPEEPTEWAVTHPSWQGNLILEGKDRVYLDVNGDYATILSNKDGILTVKWDNWGTESFQCNDQNQCTKIATPAK